MRLCRFEHEGASRAGFYDEQFVIPLSALADKVGVAISSGDSLLPFLTQGEERSKIVELEQKYDKLSPDEREHLKIPAGKIKLLVPVPNPTKLLLLAGNYSEHIREGGGHAEERANTFPYVFMKPPLTTLTHPGDPVRIPAVSPNYIDWELELGVIIGRRCSEVSEKNALDYVAGYTVVNDISDRKFKPNPNRVKREKDGFFDWLHGKWHDTFCPMGPCVLAADELPDPQTLHMTLKVNGETEQDASTGLMIFPVAAIIEFISSYITLEPGDIISTGTPAGVGNAKGKYLHSGDVMEAYIEKIGTLRNPLK
ncbi:MAG: fumarylacetoacetate hydrolase family protein [Planctomycetaceae bacterium]